VSVSIVFTLDVAAVRILCSKYLRHSRRAESNMYEMVIMLQWYFMGRGEGIELRT